MGIGDSSPLLLFLCHRRGRLGRRLRLDCLLSRPLLVPFLGLLGRIQLVTPYDHVLRGDEFLQGT